MREKSRANDPPGALIGCAATAASDSLELPLFDPGLPAGQVIVALRHIPSPRLDAQAAEAARLDSNCACQ